MMSDRILTFRSKTEYQSGKCADGWETHGRQHNCFSKKSLTWTQSRDECVRMRSHLAIIHDEDEQVCCVSFISSLMMA